MSDSVRWTNPSVLALAEGHDPVEVITERARDLVFAARENGWLGPPFDPFALADQQGVAVVAVEDLRDARLVHVEGRPRIEFNPNRPRPRVRFSVAHELGHLLFPDAADQPRYRAHSEERRADDWQMELLCNLAAAEFLMPIGGFPELEDEGLDINHLLELRAEFEVSTEALMLRVAKLTGEPGAVFAAALVDSGRGRYRIDYAVPTRGWAAPFTRGEVVDGGPLKDCTAVGFTAKGEAKWGKHLRVECVGIPPYPGERHPRVVGLVRPPGQEPQGPGITYVHGDATKPRGSGPQVIAHVVNDATPNWGGRGFAVALKEAYPGAQDDFKRWAHGGNLELGATHEVDVGPDLHVVTIVAQRGYGASEQMRLRYGALESGLERLAAVAKELGASVHMPMIGAGQAGGDWATVKELVLTEVCDRGIDVVVYRLPGEPLPERTERQLALRA